MPKILRQFIKYAIVGGSGVVIDLSVLAFLKEIVGVTPWLAVAFNQLIVITYNFLLNKHWSFKNKELPHWQFVRYICLVAINYLIAVTLMYLFNEIYGYQYLVVRISTILVSVSWNFALYKFWVFPEEKKEPLV